MCYIFNKHLGIYYFHALFIHLFIYIYVYTEEYETICVLDTIHFDIYYEEENLKKIVGGYLSIFQFDNHTNIRIDATKPAEHLAKVITNIIIERLKQ